MENNGNKLPCSHHNVLENILKTNVKMMIYQLHAENLNQFRMDSANELFMNNYRIYVLSNFISQI